MSGSGDIKKSWQEYDITVLRTVPPDPDVPLPGAILHEHINEGGTAYPSVTGNTDRLGWTFTALSSYTLSYIRLQLFHQDDRWIGSPYVSIANATGDFPVGSDLAYAARSHADLTYGAPGFWMGFTLDTPINIIIGQRYTILLRNVEAEDTGWENISWKIDNVLPTTPAGGVYVYTDDDGVSWGYGTDFGAIATACLMFECWEYE